MTFALGSLVGSAWSWHVCEDAFLQLGRHIRAAPASSRTCTCNRGDVRFHSFSTVIYISNVTSQLREAEKQRRSSINLGENEDAKKVELFIKMGTRRFGQQEREQEGSDAMNTVVCSAPPLPQLGISGRYQNW